MRATLRLAIVIVGGLAVVGLLALMAWGVSTNSPVTGLSGITRINQPAPEFTLPLLEGEPFELSDLESQAVVVNFWASWCKPCRDEAVALERTWRGFRDRGVVFVGVNVQDNETSAREYVAEFGITYPNGRDTDGTITVEYGVVGLPVTFFVGRTGVVERRWVGAISETRLVAWVEELLLGAPVSGEVEGENPDSFFRLDR